MRALLLSCLLGTAAGLSKPQFDETDGAASIPEHPRDMVDLPESNTVLPLDGDFPSEDASLSQSSQCEGHIEELTPIESGAAYVGKIYVGYKEFTCLPDTGSFDLEIISKDCKTLKGDGYSSKSSKFYQKHPDPNSEFEDLMFGSGPCRIKKGRDLVGLSNGKQGAHDTCQAQTCPIGEILETSIHQLTGQFGKKDFDAVCGYGLGPNDKKEHRLISKLGIQRIGFCFRKDVMDGGIAHWNYNFKDQVKKGFRFSTVNAVGPYWGLGVRAATISFPEIMGGKKEVFACGDSPCLAVMDTGTTMHSMDTAALDRFRQLVGDREDLDCDSGLFEKLPKMCYDDENGNSMCLKPQDYVYQMDHSSSFQQLPASIRESMAFSPENFPSLLEKKQGGKQCLLAFADSGEPNMHVFGMQWFRTHWFGFDTKSSAISWAKHDGNCNPAQKGSNFHLIKTKSGSGEGVNRLRMFNPYKIRPSGIVARIHHAKKKGKLHYQALLKNIGMHEIRHIKFKQSAPLDFDE